MKGDFSDRGVTSKTRDNHFVPQWYQKGFMNDRDDQLCYLSHREIDLKNGNTKTVISKRWHTPAQQFYRKDLYSTFFGAEINDDIEHKLFGPIDDNGSKAIRAFLSNDQSQWHHNFQNFFIYLDTQKLRTPKGLDWIKSKYPELSQLQLMMEMQSLRSMHCTLWSEGVRELVSAEDSDIKFIVSDHPVTVYNYACPPSSKLCGYPDDPDISLKGSQTIFPLSKNRCLILTNLEYAKKPDDVNPLEQRTNPTRVRPSMVSTIEFISSRKLSAVEVSQINHIIKSRAISSVAAGKEEWLYPENNIKCDWGEIKRVLLPPMNELHRFGGEIYARFDDGSVHYQDAFGRTTPKNKLLDKNINEAQIGRNDFCGCGSGRKYKNCCRSIPIDLRTTWSVASIRERNLAFCNCIRGVLGLDSGKTWVDVRRELSNIQISRIYEFYSTLWPRETDVYSLLPKSDGKFRALYSGILDVRTIGTHALPMATLFDELLIENPIINPNNIKPEFSPVKSPEKHKYQALKDFLFMLNMEPFIGLGLVNLIPNPIEFDLDLMSAMMEMARARAEPRTPDITSEQDKKLSFRLTTEDLLNSMALMPRDVKIKMLVSQFGLTEKHAEDAIVELEESSENSPLTMLQQLDSDKASQLFQFRMGPNYEMALFVAQVTGSVLVTDSGSRWRELVTAQHRDQGIINYPWSNAFDHLISIPIDYQLLEKFQKSQSHFATFRNLIKSTDRMILDKDRDPTKLSRLADQAKIYMSQIEKTVEPMVTNTLKVLSPAGGIYDAHVQRLLARSGCSKYDNQVRSVYGVSLQI
ncbi:DUF4238 domain-containing protein [Pseudomonas corrugata]|uniref:DUF4238 domain-containing protein n=1 Tax=Pseudomonas corrugata TaxID=47879 RepID=A0A8B6UX85_9PSED|nr:DUF4238 domain-containing protein [Pseudomonas corrugata]QTH16512.1 DUF4238 domain-containing protein [Pseudomonas corrugata]